MCNNHNNVDVSCNVQATVDAKHKLIVDFKVSQKPDDLGELDNMALRVKKLFGGKEFEALADKGYYTRRKILRNAWKMCDRGVHKVNVLMMKGNVV